MHLLSLIISPTFTDFGQPPDHRISCLLMTPSMYFWVSLCITIIPFRPHTFSLISPSPGHIVFSHGSSWTFHGYIWVRGKNPISKSCPPAPQYESRVLIADNRESQTVLQRYAQQYLEREGAVADRTHSLLHVLLGLPTMQSSGPGAQHQSRVPIADRR
jgi:hypothetical protein